MSDDVASLMAARFEDISKRRRASRDKEYSDDLNSTFNFRCNDELKEDFKQLCKSNQMTTSSVLKRYILSCIRAGKVV
ncbi:Antitoxin [Vibrio crassostreae]|nr:Antitoxin [Vibrio crassostreae]